MARPSLAVLTLKSALGSSGLNTNTDRLTYDFVVVRAKSELFHDVNQDALYLVYVGIAMFVA
jgi:hypothetical protein